MAGLSWFCKCWDDRHPWKPWCHLYIYCCWPPLDTNVAWRLDVRTKSPPPCVRLCCGLLSGTMSRPCPTQQPVSGVWFSLADPHRHPPCCLSDINNSTRNPRENGNRQMDQLWPRRPQWTAGISSVSRLSRYLQNGVDIYTDIYPMPRPASALDPGLHLSVRMLWFVIMWHYVPARCAAGLPRPAECGAGDAAAALQ